MRASLVAALSVVSAAVGGVAAAIAIEAADSDPAPERTTVVVTSNAPELVEATPRSLPALARTRFDPARIYASRSSGVVTVYAFFGGGNGIPDDFNHASQGSGFVVSRAGHLLTNAHVVTTGRGDGLNAARRVYVEFEDGDRIAARVVGWDAFNDVAVLKVDRDAHPLTPVPLGNSASVVVGEPVAAIGSPFGKQNTLTVGVVSATERSLPSLNALYQLAGAIQTDAAINHGNSGGPLFDARGRVIGINAQIRSDSGVNEGVGFAIPINSAKRSLHQLVSSGRVRYAYVGVSTDDLTPALARRFGYPAPYGAVVACVKDGSPGAKAGLRAGTESDPGDGPAFVDDADLIVAIDGRRVRSGADLIRIVSEHLEPGRVATFTIFRGAERRRIQIRLGERPRESSACED